MDDPDASDHRLHNQLAAELLDAVDLLAHLPGDHKAGVLVPERERACAAAEANRLVT